MGVVGMSLSISDFKRLQKYPTVVIAGVLGPALLLPCGAIGIVKVFSFSASVEVGILLVAACPAGGVSNLFCYAARANTALSVTMTGFASILAVVTMPLIIQLFLLCGLDAEVFSVPVAQLLIRLVLLMVLPIFLGMFIRHKWEQRVLRLEHLFRRISITSIVVLTTIIFVKGSNTSARDLMEIIVGSTTFCLLALGAGWSLGRICRVSHENRLTLMIEFAVQNVAIAVAIAVTVFGDVKFAVFGATYMLVQLLVVGIAILVVSRRGGSIYRSALD